jgi:hypothetical protein
MIFHRSLAEKLVDRINKNYSTLNPNKDKAKKDSNEHAYGGHY